MKTLVLVILLISGALDLYSQNVSDSIEIRISSGVHFRQHGKRLSPGKMLEIMKPNNTAYREMESAKSKSDLSWIFGVSGGVLIGWTIGKEIAQGYSNKLPAGVGVILSIASFSLAISSDKQARVAAEYYNEGLRLSGTKNVSTYLGLCEHGFGLTISF